MAEPPSPAEFEELDSRPTRMGVISLRRRLEPSLLQDVYEAKLDDEFLMSSLFTVAETALATLALDELPGSGLDVAVGGLGLGYTAAEALRDPRVCSLDVIEALPAVIEWHQQDLVPLAGRITSDPRCRLIPGDFFAAVEQDGPFAPGGPDRYHAVLVDIDHTPRHWLHPSHATFYQPEGLRRLVHRLHPGGVFALWTDGASDDAFLAALRRVFGSSTPHRVAFPNPYTGGESASTVYVARRS